MSRPQGHELWEFTVIMGCGVAGFFLVSFLTEAFGFGAGPESPKEGANSQTNEKFSREPAWFEVLGVLPSASVDEIKSAYRELARQYHPDRVEGLGKELREIAEQKMKQLNSAYQYALRVK